MPFCGFGKVAIFPFLQCFTEFDKSIMLHVNWCNDSKHGKQKKTMVWIHIKPYRAIRPTLLPRLPLWSRSKIKLNWLWILLEPFRVIIVLNHLGSSKTWIPYNLNCNAYIPLEVGFNCVCIVAWLLLHLESCHPR